MPKSFQVWHEWLNESVEQSARCYGFVNQKIDFCLKGQLNVVVECGEHVVEFVDFVLGLRGDFSIDKQQQRHILSQCTEENLSVVVVVKEFVDDSLPAVDGYSDPIDEAMFHK